MATLPAPAAAPPAPAGRLIGRRYRLRSLLGRGGMARVWLADDETMHRPVALKQNLLDDADSPQSREAAWARALVEARAAARVRHPGVVTILDFLRDDGLPWIVMEPLPGPTVAERVRAFGPLPTDEVVHLGLCLLDALGAVHRAGVVHRDVKPSNVHLADGGRVVLIDFGIACIDGEPGSAPADTFAGSPAYVAPEVILGEPATPAADLFSLGATLYAAVEGSSPFDKGELAATLTAVVDEPPAPSEHAGALRPVIDGLLSKSPGRRLSAGQARAALIAIERPHRTDGRRPRGASFRWRRTDSCIPVG